MTTLAPPSEEQSGSAITCCRQCGSTTPWKAASWCPDCGYYPKFQAQASPKPAAAPSRAATPSAGPAHAETLWQAIPAWGWVLLTGIAFILVESAVGRCVTRSGTWQRTVWALGQLSLGALAFVIAHFVAFLRSVTRSSKFTPFDLVLKPIAIWEYTIKQLPKRAWLAWQGSWAITAMIAALAIVGGIRYAALFEDWGFEKRPQTNLVKAIVDKATKEKEGIDGDLEDAMNAFVGEAGIEETPVEDWPAVDCLVFGYTQNNAKEIEEILLATMVDEKLKYVGSIWMSDLPEGFRAELRDELPELRTSKQFVNCDVKANWLKPRLMCRIAYKDWTKAKQLRSPTFRSQLEDVTY